MPEYRTCVSGDGGAIMRSYSFSANDDDQAVQQSGNIEGSHVEIWQGERLVKRLEQTVASGNQPTVELRADGELVYQQVVQLMALIQNAGVTKLAFLTEPSAALIPSVQPAPSAGP